MWILTPSNSLIQCYSIVLSLILVVFFIAVKYFNDQSSTEFLSNMLKLAGLAAVAMVIIGVFLLPASGRFADFLRWHAVTSTLLIITVVVAGLIVG